MIILVGYYSKVKRRNSLGKLYYKWILVWDSEYIRKIQELNNDWSDVK